LLWHGKFGMDSQGKFAMKFNLHYLFNSFDLILNLIYVPYAAPLIFNTRRWFLIHAGLIFICISIRQRWFKFHFNLLGSVDFFLQFNLADNVDFHLGGALIFKLWLLFICSVDFLLAALAFFYWYLFAFQFGTSSLSQQQHSWWFLFKALIAAFFIRSRQQYSAFSFDFNLHRRMHGLMFFFIILLRSDI